MLDIYKNKIICSLFVGNKWHLRRKILTPTFHFKILENFIPIFNKNAQLLTRKLNDDSVINSACIDIDLYISLCTLDVICGEIILPNS